MNEALEIILKAIDKAKGENTLVYKFNTLNPFIDHVIITSASNMRQVGAIADYVREAMLEHDLGYGHIEGNDSSKWVLVDSDHIVVHIFEETERQLYALEKLYASCEKIFGGSHV